jgi:hypothetical protein
VHAYILPNRSYVLPFNMRCTLCVAMRKYKLCSRETKTFTWFTVNWTFSIKRECCELFSGNYFPIYLLYLFLQVVWVFIESMK